MRRVLLTICLVIALPGAAFGQAAPAPTSSPSPKPSLDFSREKLFVKNLLLDQKAIWTSPAHVKTGDIWWLGAIGVGTAGLIASDRKTGDWIAGYPDLVGPSDAVSRAGAGYTVAAAAGTFYLIGRVTKNERLWETGMLGGQALINTLIVTHVTKGITQRARPDSGEERGEFFVGGLSFPSGHASNVWSLAAIVASEYHEKKAVVIAAYSAAGVISLSRFTAQRHYLSDILVGSAIGFGVGKYVYRAHHIEPKGASQSGTGKWPLIAPQFSPRAGAYRINLTWIY